MSTTAEGVDRSRSDLREAACSRTMGSGSPVDLCRGRGARCSVRGVGACVMKLVQVRGRGPHLVSVAGQRYGRVRRTARRSTANMLRAIRSGHCQARVGTGQDTRRRAAWRRGRAEALGWCGRSPPGSAFAHPRLTERPQLPAPPARRPQPGAPHLPGRASRERARSMRGMDPSSGERGRDQPAGPLSRAPHRSPRPGESSRRHRGRSAGRGRRPRGGDSGAVRRPWSCSVNGEGADGGGASHARRLLSRAPRSDMEPAPDGRRRRSAGHGLLCGACTVLVDGQPAYSAA